MTDKERMLGDLLSQIADELNITPEMYDKAVRAYETVGEWLSKGIPYDVKITPQGSMNLGTVVRPISDADEYDMDLVCLLKNGGSLPLNRVKKLVGDRLKEHGVYKDKLEKEGKRCWTLQYEEFHMDILPSVPRGPYYIEPWLTAITLTHKNVLGVYEPRYSDPYAYHTWFEEQMAEVLRVEKQAFAVRNNVDIDKVPTYKVRTPLQKVIQLLKRHRDILFQDDSDAAPISIIITTLAAKAYNGESNVYEALCNIVDKMPGYIENRGGDWWITNPVLPEENFADKWNEDTSKHTAFKYWLKRVKQDLITDPLAAFGQDTIANMYKQSLGEKPVTRAMKGFGYGIRKERECGNLYMNGLAGGLTTTPVSNSKPVKDHVFYGK